MPLHFFRKKNHIFSQLQHHFNLPLLWNFPTVQTTRSHSAMSNVTTSNERRRARLKQNEINSHQLNIKLIPHRQHTAHFLPILLQHPPPPPPVTREIIMSIPEKVNMATTHRCGSLREQWGWNESTLTFYFHPSRRAFSTEKSAF